MKLVIEDDEGNRQEIPVDGLVEVTLGRAADNTVQLPERNVSRRHARLFTESGALLVEDLHSSNGLLLNGEKVVGPKPLHDGDLLRIGAYGVVLQHDTDSHRIQVVEVEPVESLPAAVHDTAPHPVANLITEAQPRLLALNGRLRDTLWTVGRSEIRIGKDPQAELSLPLNSLADFHAKLVQTAGNEWRIQEVEHAPLRVNGIAASDTPLREGDVLELGALRLRFIGPGAHVPPLAVRRKSRLPLFIAVVLAAFLLGLALFKWGGRGPPSPVQAVPPAAPEPAPTSTPASPPVAEAPAPANAEPTESTLTPAAPTDALEAAQAAMQARDFVRALQLLNGVKDPKKSAEVAALRRTARAEATAGRAVAAAQRDLDAGRPGAALRHLKGAHGTRAFALEAEVVRSRATEALRSKPARKSASHGPTSAAQALYLEARRHFDAHQLPEAVAGFTRCLEKDPDFARCQLMLGASYEKLGQMDDAAQHYRRFLALTPADDPEVPRVKKVLEDSENQKKTTGQSPQH